jgi:Fur family ferric uptake transcriptional regulator
LFAAVLQAKPHNGMNSEPEQRLLEKQITPTAMRLRVLEYLLQQEHAVSLADVEKALGRADRITLYRTLKTFEEKCLVHIVTDSAGLTKYALCDGRCLPGSQHQDTHVHFSCTSCGETFCLPETTIPRIQLPGGFRPEEVSLLVKGVCPSCAEKNATRLQAVME